MKAILCSLVLIQVAANAKLTSDPLEVSSTGPRMKQVMRMAPSTTPFFSSEAKALKALKAKILHQARMTYLSEQALVTEMLFQRLRMDLIESKTKTYLLRRLI